MVESLQDGVEEAFNHGLTDLDFEHIKPIMIYMIVSPDQSQHLSCLMRSTPWLNVPDECIDITTAPWRLVGDRVGYLVRTSLLLYSTKRGDQLSTVCNL